MMEIYTTYNPLLQIILSTDAVRIVDGGINGPIFTHEFRHMWIVELVCWCDATDPCADHGVLFSHCRHTSLPCNCDLLEVRQ